MLAKLFFCAVICLALNQACLAEAQQETTSQALHFPDKYFEPRADTATCRERLGEVSNALLTELRRHGELVGAIVDFGRRAVPPIASLYFRDLFSNMSEIFGKLFNAVTGCLARKYLQHFEPVLNLYKQYNNL